jgi:hypothetical protein
MQKVTRQQIFSQAAKKLRQDFEELSIVPHAGLKGHEAEDIVRSFLRGHLPKRFDLGSGFIIDLGDSLSKQTDLIIYDALNCPVYRASENAAIIPSDNVAAVVEVKSRLDKQTMEEAFINISAVKSLSKTKLPDLPFSTPVLTQTYGALFAFTTPLSLETLQEHYTEFSGLYGIGRHIDVVLILDKGIITLAGRAPGLEWAPLMLEGFGGEKGEGAHIGTSLIATGEDSLDMFLRFLLGQLIHFRGLVGHPGFKWVKDGAPGQMHVHYITTITNEQDPNLRKKKLDRYAEEIRAQFEQASSAASLKPKKRGKESSATTPDVIHLPSPDIKPNNRKPAD